LNPSQDLEFNKTHTILKSRANTLILPILNSTFSQLLNMITASIRALRDVGMSFFPHHIFVSRPDLFITLQQTIQNCLANRISLDAARSVLQGLIGTTEPLERLSHILQIGPDPIPVTTPVEIRDSIHRKIRPWSPYEDERLLCGIYRFGIENWTSISKFVGNNRTRSQCSQRWYRGLNPSINKFPWTGEEEDRLVGLVRLMGERSWTQIAAQMGTRTDVQCRYRYKQMQKEGIRPPDQEHRRGFPAALPWPPMLAARAATPLPMTQSSPPPVIANVTRQLLPPVSSLTELPFRNHLDVSPGKGHESDSERALSAHQSLEFTIGAILSQ
jgi:hypothetical protein